MREIKFRAWNRTDKCWDIPKTEYSISQGAKSLFGRSGKNIRFNRGDIILMQYTGLKDKTGKEIYEGDIVNIKRYVHKKYECGYVKWANVIAQWLIECDCGLKLESYSYGVRIEEIDLIEVIGNIYKHKDLLDGR